MNHLKFKAYAYHRNSRMYCVYICSCGQECVRRKDAVDLNATKSCGCLRVQRNIERSLKHGEAGRTSEYLAWSHMKSRCFNKDNTRYKDYGGRGITVYGKWINSYESFLADLGKKPSPDYSLDRIDNNGNYEPSNCRWATRSQQQKNKRKFKHKV